MSKKNLSSKYITENFQKIAEKEEILKVSKKKRNPTTYKRSGIRIGIILLISTPDDNEALPS